MSDTEQLPDNEIDIDLDDYAHQTCYIFKPSTDLNDRPKKRRRITLDQPEVDKTLPLLCNGTESAVCARARYETLHKLWDQQQVRIDETVSQLDNNALKEIIEFVKEDYQSRTERRLRTGLVVTGSDTSVQARLLDQWRSTQTPTTELISEVRSSACPNLQTALKTIIKSTISETVGQDGYQDFFNQHKRLIPMNFDLELLQLWVEEQHVSKVVISILDVETFDTNILSELITTLRSWSDRIPFVVLIGIATTVELFELRLPKSTIGLLETTIFTLTSSADLFHDILSGMQIADDSVLFFGPATISMLYDLSQNQSTTVKSFTKVLQCAYMSHFFANPLSAFLSNDKVEVPDADVLCETIRNTDSFQSYCEMRLADGKPELPLLRELLEDDKELPATMRSTIGYGRQKYRSALQTIAAISDLKQQLLPKVNESVFEIDLMFYNHLDDLTKPEVLPDILTAFEELKSSDLLKALQALRSTTHETLGTGELLDRVKELEATENQQQIRSSHHASFPKPKIKTTTLSDGRKSHLILEGVNLNLSSAEDKYSHLINHHSEAIADKMGTSSFKGSATLLQEAFIYNSRQPLQNSFTPRPRFALERALSKPGDYLGCECCSIPHLNHLNQAHDQPPPPPPTSILYNLLQEAGTTINVRDLFDAFSSQLFPPSFKILPQDGEVEKEIEDEAENGAEAEHQTHDKSQSQSQSQTRLTLALFYRSLSELKSLGMIKSATSTLTKKRALASNGGDGGRRGYAEIDFVGKTCWAGL